MNRKQKLDGTIKVKNIQMKKNEFLSSLKAKDLTLVRDIPQEFWGLQSEMRFLNYLNAAHFWGQKTPGK